MNPLCQSSSWASTGIEHCQPKIEIENASSSQTKTIKFEIKEKSAVNVSIIKHILASFALHPEATCFEYIKHISLGLSGRGTLPCLL